MSIALWRETDIANRRALGIALLSAVAVWLFGSGLVALFLGVTRIQLAPDLGSLSISYPFLCSLADGRVVAFMAHDRTAFGGAIVADAVMYLWLIHGPIARGERWASGVLAVSGAIGFACLLSLFGTRYVDVIHLAAALVMMPPFVAGLVLVHDQRPDADEPRELDWPSRGRLRPDRRSLVLLTGLGIVAAGIVITTVGSSVVFVPQDIDYLGLDRAALDAIDAHLVPLIAHDRASFGGALASTGIAVAGAAAWGRPSPSLAIALTAAGVAGFGAALGTHLLIGYLDPVHLAPGIVAAAAFGVGMIVWRPWTPRSTPRTVAPIRSCGTLPRPFGGHAHG